MNVNMLLRRFFNIVLLMLFMGVPILFQLTELPKLLKVFLFLVLLVSFLFINLAPLKKKYPNRKLTHLAIGTELLFLFQFTLYLNIVMVIFFLVVDLYMHLYITSILLTLVHIFLCEAILFWNGMIRVYTTSTQLGLKWRFIGILCGFLPIVNLIVLVKMCRITKEEVNFEVAKYELDHIRVTSEICKTKYPLLLVHGVFFRDSNLLNYWGRIPGALKRNGATIYYGQQESADSVEKNGAQLAEKILSIVKESGCEKVNIVAHSKGGLDARYAISCLNMNQYVASLTTINTPHHGCIFTEYLLHKATPKFKDKVAKTYGKTFKKLGDEKPDFLAAVNDLTISRCKELNMMMPNAPDVYYQSVGSYAKKAANGKFPVNISYPIVRRFDGENDGLVSISSAEWGEKFTLLAPTGNRGITHADVIDLNRENITGFDVREFYVNLVSELKQLGF